MTISAKELALALGRDEPTEEQITIIESPLEPALVIAGAGSGKTETMASRVVWLVANGLVKVDEVLGMTFTRKAAGELATRIRKRLAQLASTGIVDIEFDDLDQATVTTYNSFAHRIYSQYGLLIGRDPDSTVLGEAAAWQLARSICRDAEYADISSWGKGLDALTEAVLKVARALADNVADPQEVRDYAHNISQQLEDLVEREGVGKKSSFQNLATVSQTLPALVDLATTYAQTKRRLGLIEFSDQVALALEICSKFDSVVEDYRSQFKVILLDEYQDTSVVQARLLSTLFDSLPVMAVGDPHQSIYGWRGASADNIEQFPRHFASRFEGCEVYSLSTSWRNPVSVLAAANVLMSPLSEKVSLEVKELSASHSAPAGELEVAVSSTIFDEADHLAQWLKQRVNPETTAAMLCRSLKNIGPFKAALDRHNVPYHVVGIGGLLDEPVIADVVCMLRVLHDATADSELVRLLSGGRWRIGTKDLQGLSAIAYWLSNRDFALQKLDPSITNALRESVVNDEGASLIDALDFIARTNKDYEVFNNVSSEGLQRLKDAGQTIARLRLRTGADLRDLVTLVQQELLLDIEARANESAKLALTSLEAFMEPVVAFVNGEDRATLGGFLSWLREAESKEKLSPQSPPSEPGTVQIMTIHGAKGLEWDVVALPRMVMGELPGNRSKAENWVGFGQLPFEFRGDNAHLPVFGWRSAQSHKELEQAYADFVEEVRVQYDDEQRRLAYVAVTRSKHSLLLSASFWSALVNPRPPGTFLMEISEAGLLPEAINPVPNPDTNPLEVTGETVLWPLDPLGNRRDVVLEAAESVATASSDAQTPWDFHISMLLAERDRIASAHEAVVLPRRIASSKFKDYVSSPADMAKALRRPLPEQPFKATALGTIFHQWVENRSQQPTYPELVDALIDEDDLNDLVESDAETLAALKKTFEKSKWGNMKPAFVELPIELPLAGSIFSCKIDAIYEVDNPDGIRWQIVDWKTGKAPKDDEDLELKQFQLALYRLAFSKLKNIPIEQIDAVFYFVGEDREIRPERIYSDKELEERWSSSTGGSPR